MHDYNATEGAEDTDLDVEHVVWADGVCRISVNGQGHLPCKEHTCPLRGCRVPMPHTHGTD